MTKAKAEAVKSLPAVAPIIPPSFMEMLSRAIMSGAAPEIIERLMSAQERWERNEARRAYDAAVAEARAEMKPIIKTNEVNLGGNRSYKYEGLDDIERAVLDALSKYGLTYGFSSRVSDSDARMLIVTCRLKHKDGYFEETSLPGPIDNTLAKNPIQAIGSTTTYLARYTLRLALGLAPTTDDDAQAATRKPAPPGKNVMLHEPNHDPATGEVKEPPAATADAADAADRAPASGATPLPATGGGPALQSVEDLARDAAKKGDAAFKAFYKLRDGKEQARINKIGAELRELIDIADDAKRG